MQFDPCDQFTFYKKICNCLDKLYEADFTQQEIANMLGVTDRCIRKWENNKSLPVGLHFYNLLLLCKRVGD